MPASHNPTSPMARWGLVALASLALSCATPPPVQAEREAEAMALTEASAAPAEEPMSDHCAKMAEPEPEAYARTEVAYTLPDLALVDQSGRPFQVRDLEALEQPVAVNFIFATCTTICPVMTATFSRTRAVLGEDAERIRMVSISIDPDHDTPAVLASYAERFDAPSDWLFLTGDRGDVEQVLRGFDAYSRSKFDHDPITVLHAPGSDHWVRLDGLGSAEVLAGEVRGLLRGPAIQ